MSLKNETLHHLNQPLKGIVILTKNTPYMITNGWVHYWHADKKWVTLRPIKALELIDRKHILPPDQALMYGIQHDETLLNGQSFP